jgi:hypothetical protein
MKTKKIAAFAAIAAMSVTAAACGDDNEESASTGSQQSEQAKPVAELPDLSNGKTTKVTLDAGFVQALTDLKVAPAPVGEASISTQGVATFPITGGNVTYYEPGTVSPFVQGRLDHDGSGLSLTAGGKKVELTDFVIDPGASVLTGDVSVDGKVAAEGAPLFFLDGSTLQPLRTGENTAVLEGTTVKLKKEAAELLNTTFGIDALTEGLVIGVAKITVDTSAA